MGAIDGGHALRRDAEEAFRASAALRRRLTRARQYKTFGFQPVEGGVDGADRNFTLCSRLDLAPNRYTVGLFIQTQNREKHNVLEFAKIVAICH